MCFRPTHRIIYRPELDAHVGLLKRGIHHRAQVMKCKSSTEHVQRLKEISVRLKWKKKKDLLRKVSWHDVLGNGSEMEVFFTNVIKRWICGSWDERANCFLPSNFSTLWSVVAVIVGKEGALQKGFKNSKILQRSRRWFRWGCIRRPPLMKACFGWSLSRKQHKWTFSQTTFSKVKNESFSRMGCFRVNYPFKIKTAPINIVYKQQNNVM